MVRVKRWTGLKDGRVRRWQWSRDGQGQTIADQETIELIMHSYESISIYCFSTQIALLMSEAQITRNYARNYSNMPGIIVICQEL